MIDSKLRGKVVLITGANHGIGAVTAKAFAAQGATLFINYLGQPPSDGVVKAIRDAGGWAEAWEADLAAPDTIPELFERANRIFGPVDVLVNNAAVGGSPKDTFLPVDLKARDEFGRDTRTVTGESRDRHFAVNSRAVALMMAEFARRHVERGSRWGRIINVSTEGSHGAPGEVSYWASKAALESYGRAAALEFARYGITVNVVAPGAIQTGWIPKEKEPKIAAGIPLGRVGQPEDVADVIVFLASDQARWLTGQILFVGGGHRMI